MSVNDIFSSFSVFFSLIVCPRKAHKNFKTEKVAANRSGFFALDECHCHKVQVILKFFHVENHFRAKRQSSILYVDLSRKLSTPDKLFD